MSTFAELKAENEKLWNDLHSLTKKSEEFEENFNRLLTEKELAKAFKPFEVIIDKTFSWGSEKSVKLKFTDFDVIGQTANEYKYNSNYHYRHTDKMYNITCI